jgi:RHS repeat-associated protein
VGRGARFSHDVLKRRIKATYADGARANFRYVAAGRLLQADDTADPHRPITLSYDSLDRLLSETTSLGSLGYQYDSLGRRTTMTVSGQSPVTYAYDAASRLRTITQAPLTPVDIQYDALGRRTLLTLPNGVSTEYVYDPGSRLTALVYRNALGPLGELTYQYDPAGNRVAVGGSFARTLLPDPVPSATYDAANRQLTFGDKTMTFDANGNLTTLTEPTGTTTYTWDARNRLSALSGATTGSFAYDAQGRRAWKTIDGDSVGFQYDRLGMIREVTGGREFRHLRGLGIDETLARTDLESTLYFLSDGLPSVLALVDTTGNIATTYGYEPFGRTVVGGVLPTNRLQFSRREHDGGGLYYFRARYLHVGLGRFIQQDPAGLAGGDVNMYAYVRNNPLLLIDPLGLQTWPGSGPITSPFGPRGSGFHNGIDVRNPRGGPVPAYRSGTVISTDPAPCRDPRCNGPTNQVLIQHPDGSITGYGHTDPSVHPGQGVQEGQPIGETDMSGRSTGPHVHFTYRPGPNATPRDAPVNPLPHLPPTNNYPESLRRPESPGAGGGGGDDLGGRK